MASFTKDGVTVRPYIVGTKRRFHLSFAGSGDVILSDEDFHTLQEFDIDGFNHPSTGWVERKV